MTPRVPGPLGRRLRPCILAAMLASVAFAGGCSTRPAGDPVSGAQPPHAAPGATPASPLMTPPDY